MRRALCHHDVGAITIVQFTTLFIVSSCTCLLHQSIDKTMQCKMLQVINKFPRAYPPSQPFAGGEIP